MNWTYEKCKEEASKYETRSQFYKGNSSAYNASRSNGWLDDFFVRKNWDYKACREEAKKYSTINEFSKGCHKAYTVALERNWLQKWFHDARHDKVSQWTEEMCLKEAKKYTSKVAFQKGSVTAYQVALRKGWIKDYDWFKRPEPHNKGKIKWTYDKCKAAFEAARQNGWIEEWLEEKRSNFGIEIKK